ncbi:hypothetical protein J7K99_01600 [bacterium]|nr:hypothetical protein [bacterium]
MRNAGITFLLVGVIFFAAFGQTSLSRTGQTQVSLGGKDIWVVSIGDTDYAFVNAWDDGIRKINLSTYSVVDSFTGAAVRDIWLRDSMVYVAAWVDTFYILRQSDLTVKGKSYLKDSDCRATCVGVMDRTSSSGELWMYLGIYNLSDNHSYIFVVDVHNPSSPWWPLSVDGSNEYKTDLGEGYVYDMYTIYGGESGFVSRGNSAGGTWYGWAYLFLLLEDSTSSYKFSLRRPAGWFYRDDYNRAYSVQTGDPAGVLEDEYTLSLKPHSLWLAGHDGDLYAYIADGDSGLYVFPVYPDTAVSATDDIRDPVVANWTHNTGDDFRDVYVFGDLGFVANYTDGTAGGGKMFYVLDISDIELGDIDTTASVDGYFATGIWGDSVSVHVVADSLR